MGVRGDALAELLDGMRLEREKEEWGCRKMYPPEGRKGPNTKVQLRPKVVCGRSPLRNEIQPEDIEHVEEVDWNDVFAKFGTEVCEANIDGGTFMDFFEDRYGL